MNKHIGIPMDKFVEENAGLAYMVANKFRNSIINTTDDFDDLKQIALFGLVKAYKNFNPPEGKKISFSSYAIPSIIGYIRTYLRDHSCSVRYPRIFKDIWSKVRKFELQDEPIGKISEILSIDEKLIEEAMVHFDRIQPLSMQMKANWMKDDGDKIELQDLMVGFNDDTNIYVEEFLKTLTEKERIVLKMSIDGEIQRDISKKAGVSQPHVSRVMKRIKKKFIEFYPEYKEVS